MEKSIIGEWDMVASEINNKPNGFTKNAYFEFKEDNTVISNIFGDEKALNFQIKNSRLVIETKEPFDLKITKLENDTLQLEGKLKYYYMKYILVRKV